MTDELAVNATLTGATMDEAAGDDDLLMLGSDAWYARRRDRWNEEARDHVRALRAYEDMHPDDSVCLSKALVQAEIAAGMVHHAH